MTKNEKKELVARYLGFEIKNEKEIASAKNPKGLRISAHTEGAESFGFYHKQKGSAAFSEGIWSSYEDLPFDTDWSWLMPVVLEVAHNKQLSLRIDTYLSPEQIPDNFPLLRKFEVILGTTRYRSMQDVSKLVFEAVVDALKPL